MATEVTNKPFSVLGIDANLLRGIVQKAGYKTMTTVQDRAIPQCLSGVDVLARARTGSGKTCAFLVPAIQTLLKGGRRGSCSCLIISPVRELALQIKTEADKFASYVGVQIQAYVGGIKIGSDMRKMRAHTPEIVIATPGRLLDHCENNDLFRGILGSIRTLILDECDRLLDMGFRDEIRKTMNYLNMYGSAAQRQTLLFSATVPVSIQQFSRTVLKKNMQYVDCVGDDKTHVHVDQFWKDTTMENQISDTFCLLKHYWDEHTNPKIIVFFSTARHTQYMAQLFNNVRCGWKPEILEIHSRLSQNRRKKVYEKFKVAKQGILFSSDVSARGLDYPDVTLILQVGITQKQQYIHRLGRTARIGKQGTGVILLSPDERFVRTSELRGLPITQFNQSGLDFDSQPELEATLDRVQNNGKLRNGAGMAYRAWLGFHNGQCRKLGWSKMDLVNEAASFARELGLTMLPEVTKRFVGKTNLRGTPGLCVEGRTGPIMLGKRKRAGQFQASDVAYSPPAKRTKMSPRSGQTVMINGQEVTLIPMNGQGQGQDQGQQIQSTPTKSSSSGGSDGASDQDWFVKTMLEELAARASERTVQGNSTKWTNDRAVDILAVFKKKDISREQFWKESLKWFDIEFEKASQRSAITPAKAYFMKQIVKRVRSLKLNLKTNVYKWASDRAGEMETGFNKKSLSQEVFWGQSSKWVNQQLDKSKIVYPTSSPYQSQAKRSGGNTSGAGRGSSIRFNEDGREYKISGQTGSKKSWKLEGTDKLAQKSQEGQTWEYV